MQPCHPLRLGGNRDNLPKNFAPLLLRTLDHLLENPSADIIPADRVSDRRTSLSAILDLVHSLTGAVRQQTRSHDHEVADPALCGWLVDLLQYERLHHLLVLVWHLEHPVIHGHHRYRQVALLVADAGCAQCHENGLGSRKAAERVDDCGDSVLADGRVIQSGLQGIVEEQLAADPRDNNIGGRIVANERLPDCISVRDVASSDLEVRRDGCF